MSIETGNTLGILSRAIHVKCYSRALHFTDGQWTQVAANQFRQYRCTQLAEKEEEEEEEQHDLTVMMISDE